MFKGGGGASANTYAKASRVYVNVSESGERTVDSLGGAKLKHGMASGKAASAVSGVFHAQT